MEIELKSIDDLPQAVEQLLAFAGDRKKWFFYGEIGAGKTTFIKAICQHLGVAETVSSPTFSLINEYTYPVAGEKAEQYIYHLDLYRLNSLEEALDIGIEDYLDNPYFCWIEWPELIEPLLLEEVVKIKLEISEHSTRKILFL